jgi:hypothetical protein
MGSRTLVPLGILCLLTALVAVVLFSGSSPEAQAATKDVTRAVTVIESDVAWTQKLMAFDRLRRERSSEAITALVKLTASKDVRVSTLACTTLARMKTTNSKAKLKTIVTDTNESDTLRQAAMNALARCGTSSDRSWIESHVATDAKLKGQLSVLKTKSFWR